MSELPTAPLESAEGMGHLRSSFSQKSSLLEQALLLIPLGIHPPVGHLSLCSPKPRMGLIPTAASQRFPSETSLAP